MKFGLDIDWEEGTLNEEDIFLVFEFIDSVEEVDEYKEEIGDAIRGVVFVDIFFVLRKMYYDCVFKATFGKRLFLDVSMEQYYLTIKREKRIFTASLTHLSTRKSLVTDNLEDYWINAENVCFVICNLVGTAQILS